MSLKKILILNFIILCGASRPLQAIFRSGFAARCVMLSLWSIYSRGDFRKPFKEMFLSNPQLKLPASKLILHSSFSGKPQGSYFTMTPQQFTRKPQHFPYFSQAQRMNTTFLELPQHNQDEQSAQLMQKILSPSNTTSFKTIANEFLKLTGLLKTYPELKQLIEDHMESPDIRAFVRELKNLAKQNKLPRQFNEVLQKQQDKMANMSWLEWGIYISRIHSKLG